MKGTKRRRGQSSVEYLFVVAISLSLIVPASYLFINHGRTTQNVVISAQIDDVGDELVRQANTIHLIGNSSWVTVDVVLPDNVLNATIYGEQELVIHYFLQGGVADAVFFSDVNIANTTTRCENNPCTLGFHPGKNKIRLSSRGDYVTIGLT